MGDPQPSANRPLPSPGPKKSPFVGGSAKADLSRAPTSPNLGGGKKAPPALPKRPTDEVSNPATIAANGGPPKVPPRNVTVANINAKTPPKTTDPAPAADSNSNASPHPVESDTHLSPVASPIPTEFEPKQAMKSATSFRDTIAIPSQSAILNPTATSGAASAGSPSAGFTDPSKSLDAALADPLFRKVEVTIAQKRDNIANELLTTEQSYLRALTIVNELYRKPMLEAVKSGIMGSITEDFVNDIFSRNLQDILRVNFTLLSGLVDRLSSWSNDQVLGDILLDLTPFLKMYTQYTATYERSNQLLDEYEAKEPLASFLAKCNEHPIRAGLTLKAFLIMPIQRIPRYRLLLEDLVKNTPDSHPDHRNLTSALEKLKIVAEQVDKAIHEQKNRELMLKIQKRVGDAAQIIEPGRIYVREGDLTKVCRKGPKKRFFALFSDILLYATENIGGRLSSVNVLKMTSLGVRDLPDDAKRNQSNAMQISSEKKSFVVFAQTPQEKALWLTDLNKTLDKFEESGRTVKNDSRQRRLSNLAPVWVPDSEARTCTICGIKFTITNRRHHCRQCGQVVCGKCSSKKKDLPGQGKQRVCDLCFEKPYDMNASHNATSSQDEMTSDSEEESNSSPVSDSYSAQADFASPIVKAVQQPVGDVFEAAFDFEPPANSNPKKLGFKAGAFITVLQKDNSGWWLAEIGGQKGWIPAAFLKGQT